MRKYQQIWVELKTKALAVVAAPPHLHARVVKAVMKERTSDLIFRYELGEKELRAKIRYEVAGNYIRFKIEYMPDKRYI